MLQTNSFAICLFSAVLAASPSALADQLPLDVMPAPAQVRILEGSVPLPKSLVVNFSGAADSRLAGAVERARARWTARSAANGAPAVFTLELSCARSTSPIPDGSEDESYTLEVNGAKGTLRAPNSLGALHGLETLLQLPKSGPDGWTLGSVSIEDRPRFRWRGLLIDVARHWEPTEVILRNLDAMAAVKLNVLHLHLSDDQGFRIESHTHPELQEYGSDGNFFTQEQMRKIIAYAASRGIRVLPEFDMPGHTNSWLVSHPELASLPGPYSIERHWGVFNPVMDPTKEETYALIKDFLGEMAALFPDPLIHIGVDENNGVQWNANPRIQAFIKERGLKDNAGLHAYFNTRVDAMLVALGKRLVGWDEILNPDLPRDCVIHSWRGTEALAAAATLGFDGLLSNGYYIDLCFPAADHYLQDPVPAASKLTEAQKSHVLGGEATMWGEFVTPETIDSRIWPRTAAIAERLWSPSHLRDVPEMYRRLAIVSDRLTEAGALHDKNGDLMLRHLVGANLEAPGVSSLKVFLQMIEPVKRYERFDRQIWMNQQVPLIGIADAAKPESEASRRFAVAVENAVFAPGAIDKGSLQSLLGPLSRWSLAGKEVSDILPTTYPGLREAIARGRGLTAASDVGTEAISSLAAGTPLGSEACSGALSRLDTAAQPDLSATILPILAPVRLLVAAAVNQEKRAGASDDQWRALVASTAAPAAPAPAH